MNWNLIFCFKRLHHLNDNDGGGISPQLLLLLSSGTPVIEGNNPVIIDEQYVEIKLNWNLILLSL